MAKSMQRNLANDQLSGVSAGVMRRLPETAGFGNHKLKLSAVGVKYAAVARSEGEEKAASIIVMKEKA
jgi:hypothetical protein